MGFKATSTRRSTATSAQSTQTTSIYTGSGYAVAGATVTGTTNVSLGVVTPGSTSATSVVTVASGPSISNIAYLDANNAIISGDIAVSTTGGNILITGSGFVANSNVYVNNALVSNTFISGTQIRAVCPAASAGNVTLMIFTPTNVGTIAPNGVRYSGSPTWTTAAVSMQNNTAANVALVASSDSTLTYTLQAGSTLPTGISLVSAGYLSGTPTGYSTNTSSTAVIIATDLEGQATQQTLNITVTTADVQFPCTTLLLSGETSVTPFISDASANSFGLTLAGDTKANKFSPYYGNGYYGVSHSATPDYLSVLHNANFSLMSGATDTFIIEGWFYFNAVTAQTSLFDKSGVNTVSFANWTVYLNASSQITLQWGISGTPGTSTVGLVASTTVPVAGTWYHIAFVKSNADWAVFANGTRIITYNGLNTANDGNATALKIGYGIQSAANGAYFNGIISNVRAWRGTSGAPYSATSTTLTVPTSPLTAIAGTTLLTHQSARFVDVSSAAAVVTATGANIKVSPAIPFTASSSYATYGSAYFDGTGDYLTTPASSVFTFGTGDFTIEFWLYSTTNTSGIFDIRNTVSQVAPYIYMTSQQMIWYVSGGNQITSSTLLLNHWYHIAVCRSNGVTKMYLNGIQTGSSYTDTNNYISNKVYIGGAFNASQMTTGWIEDLRVVNGTALYTTNFTLPTSPLTAVANTQLLTLQYNGGANNYGIIDNGPFNNVITRVGNTSQGSFSPYSPTGWSTYFNGSTDYFTTTVSSAFACAGNFTIECWVNPSSLSKGPAIGGQYSAGNTGVGEWLWLITTAGKIQYYYNGSSSFTTTSTTNIVVANIWNHIAIARVGTTITIYVNGAVAGSFTSSVTIGNATNTLYIGSYEFSATRIFPGYISNFRIVNGTALYTAAFTPSTAPLTAVANTSLLTLHNNRFNDASTNNATMTITGTPSVQAVSPFSPSAAYSPNSNGGSAYFDGTGDYLTFTEPSIVPAGTDATLELWVYPTSFTARNFLYSGGPAGAGAVAISLEATSGAAGIWIDSYGAPRFSTTTANPVLNQWNHIALVKTSGVVYCYVNGVKDAGSYTHAAAFGSGAASTIGAYNVNKGQLTFGYLSDVRYTKNVSVYTGATATVPTTALSSNTNTALLLNFTNGGIIDQHSTNIFESLAGTQISTAVKKYGNASLSFSGASSASLQFPATSQATWFGTGDFTVECWVNFAANNATYNPFVRFDGTGTFDFGYDFSTTQLKYSGSAAIFAVTQSFTVGTWYHVAITRTSGSSRLFVNGTQVGTTVTGDTNNYAAGAFKVGGSSFSAAHVMNGYIDDLRITKGFSRYTANFTPATTGFLGQ